MTAATKRTKKTKPFISIQERSRNKALKAYAEIDYAIDKYIDSGGKIKFNMYKYLVELGYSSRVVKYMQGQSQSQLDELENKENCPQLKEGYSHISAPQKRKFINFLKKIESDIDKYCEEYKPVRKVRIKTPAQLVKKLPYLKEYEGYESIDPEDIPRSRMLYTYNTSTRKLSMFEGRLSVSGSKITGIDESQERLLTDLASLDILIRGGNIIAGRFMETLKTKPKEANNRITKNTLLIKVVK
jgi:hypothetical protein